jgi:hypothetical protein
MGRTKGASEIPYRQRRKANAEVGCAFLRTNSLKCFRAATPGHVDFVTDSTGLQSVHDRSDHGRRGQDAGNDPVEGGLFHRKRAGDGRTARDLDRNDDAPF